MRRRGQGGSIAASKVARGEPMGNEVGTCSAEDPPAFSAVYEQLRRVAWAMIQGERSGHTLEATALVNEAFLKLVGREDLRGLPSDAFIAAATAAMRRILIDYARTRRRTKRGGGAARLSIDEAIDAIEERGFDIVAVDAAIEKLRALDPELARLIELRFFMGLTVEAAAVALGKSERTLARDWAVAKRWLHAEIRGEAHG